MIQLISLSAVLLSIVAGACILLKKNIKTEKAKRVVLLVVAITTVLVHYSTIPYHFFLDGDWKAIIIHNPQYLLPIYPCNVVMWLCLFVAFLKNKESKLFVHLTEFITFFGIFSGVLGMVLNFDFMANPNLLDYDVTKGMFSHMFMILNCCLFPVFGYIKINTPRNMLSVAIGVVIIFLVGTYINILFELITDYPIESINSMFLIKSPFDAVPWLTFFPIVGMLLVVYFAFFNVFELIAFKKSERWFDKLGKRSKNDELQPQESNKE